MATSRRKRSIELTLYEDHIQWLEKKASENVLPSSKSEAVSWALDRMMRDL